MGSRDDIASVKSWPLWLCDMHHVRRFKKRADAGMDAERTRDYPNFIAGSLLQPPGGARQDLTGPTCCRGLAFIKSDFVFDELRTLSEEQELHRRFWVLISAGAPLAGALYFFKVERYVPLSEALELPDLRGGKPSMFFRGSSGFCQRCYQSALNADGSCAESDGGLIDLCLFVPSPFIARLSSGSTVVSACHLPNNTDDLAGSYSYSIGWHGRFRSIPDVCYFRQALLGLRDSFEPPRFLCRDKTFFNGRALTSGEAPNLKSNHPIELY